MWRGINTPRAMRVTCIILKDFPLYISPSAGGPFLFPLQNADRFHESGPHSCEAFAKVRKEHADDSVCDFAF
jgi:hypothetical protein